MNKTININLGGIYFHIDELAYEKLRRYLDAINTSLSNDPYGKDEIITDIEARISELLSEKIKDDRQVINQHHIDEIIKVMGQPEDYAFDEELFSDKKNTYQTSHSSKKLFRDGDDKILGGVASGLGHYFGIDVIWIRILWLILVFFGGTGFLIYIIFWILVPEAKTTTEKLQMKGEVVNLSNIEKKIKEEFKDVSDRIKGADYSKAKTGAQEIVDTLGKVFATLFMVLGKFIGILIIIIATSVIIGLIAGGFSLGTFEMLGFGSEFAQYPPFFFKSTLPIWLLIVFIFTAIGIPFVFLFMLGIKIISNSAKSMGKTLKLTLLGLWLVAILGLIFSGIEYSTHTAYNGFHTTNHDLPNVITDTLDIKMIGNDEFYDSKSLRKRHGFEVIVDNGVEKLYSSKIKLDFAKSDTETAFVKIRKEAEGNSRNAANEFAEQIEYKFNLTDKKLQLDGYFLSNLENIYQNQEVEITVFLPVNSFIYLDKSTKTYLYDVENTDDIYDDDMIKHYYQMTNEGLKCLDCSEIIKNNDNVNVKIDVDGIDIKVEENGNRSRVKVGENILINNEHWILSI
ncbi:MAG TPA: PspC domain-containing protein [Flavobacteriaceae bacterium]|nr:PspC domain-containing protein [Flavobacteriaceae bacterium]HEX5743820.1 PspC domain-containing protein [Flavobacteriaceae bacterium]